MTAERDGKSRRTGQPDLLASLPDERQVPGIDPTAFEKLLTEVQDLRNDFAGLKEAVSAERPAPVTLDDLREQFAGLREAEAADRPASVPQALTPEALEAWGDKLVARVAEAARPADAPAAAPREDAAAALADHTGRIEEAAAKAAAAAERIDGGLASTADRVVAEIEGAVTRIEAGVRITRDHVTRQSRLVHRGLEDLRTQTAGPRFGLKTVLVGLIVLVFGMLIESRIHVLYGWLWSG